MAIHDYEEHARQQTELASIKAFKAFQDKKKEAKKAKKRTGKLTGDFTTDKPNVIKILKKYNNKGTVLLGYALDNKHGDLDTIEAKSILRLLYQLKMGLSMNYQLQGFMTSYMR